jgi:hypothetical protein
LIIRLIIQTIRRDPSGSVQIDGASDVSRPDPIVMVRRQPGAELGSLVLGDSRLGTVTELVWRPGAELPTDPRHPDHEGRRMYEQALQERPVKETIDALRRWFDKAAGRSP